MVRSRGAELVFRVLQAHNPTRTELVLRRDAWKQDGYSAAEAIECRFGLKRVVKDPYCVT